MADAGPAAAPVVRPRRASDTRAVRRVARRTWRATYARIAPAALVATVLRRGYAHEALLRTLLDVARDAFVVEAGGEVVGYADVVLRTAAEAEVTRLYVRPDRQGAGLGCALLLACLSAARRRGAARVVLGVDRDNRRAVAWYRRQGFVPVGTDVFEAGGASRPLVRLARDLADAPGPASSPGAPVSRR